jgi:SAM-dependent methyltransferase/uncharacterized protein YbaR (Trm112 family)
VKYGLLEFLGCPACGASLALTGSVFEEDEVIEGNLTCTGCVKEYPVTGGVPRFTAVHSAGHQPTAQAFGWQWQRFSELTDRYRQQFLDWIRPVTADFFRGKAILEGGCGKGRHTALAAQFGARAVVAIDLSEAVDVAFRNTRHLPNAHIVQADLNHPPVKRAFDYAFSVGVLHHLPDPERGFHALVSKLRPGGFISAWVYGREGNGWVVHLVTPLRERLTSRLPRRVLAPIATALSLPLWAVTKLVYGPARRTPVGKRLPYGAYLGYIADLPFGEQRTIVFDHLVAPVAFYLRQDEFAAWFQRAGLEEVHIEHHNANSWRGFARVSSAA